MRVLIAGSGEREAWLSRLCREKGHALPKQGPWDQVVLSVPQSNIPKSLLPMLPDGQKIVCGRTDEVFDQLAKERGWRLLRVLEDEEYMRKNAWLSAEGAVFAAMSQAPFALGSAHSLVIGYGRIGKALTGMLRGLGGQVTVAARRKESRKAAGQGSVSMEELPEALPGARLVFNTVPSPILREEQLSLLPRDALLFELASAPYGIDLDAAGRLGLTASLESGIPGRYCPQSAAEIFLEYMEREDDQHE